MEYVRKSWAKVRAFLMSMPPSQRYTVAALLVLVAASLVMLMTSKSDERYVAALSDLTPDQMAQMDQALSGSDIKYQFSGSVLLVDPGQKDRVLMALSDKSALPSDISKSYGFEDLLKPQGLNLQTAEQQKMKYNIALGNMIARSIETSPEIRRRGADFDGAERLLRPRGRHGRGERHPAPGLPAQPGRRARPSATSWPPRSARSSRLRPSRSPTSSPTAPSTSTTATPTTPRPRTTWSSSRAGRRTTRARSMSSSRPSLDRCRSSVTPSFDTTAKTIKETEMTVAHETSRSEIYDRARGRGRRYARDAQHRRQRHRHRTAAGPSSEVTEKEKQYAPARETVSTRRPARSPASRYRSSCRRRRWRES